MFKKLDNNNLDGVDNTTTNIKIMDAIFPDKGETDTKNLNNQQKKFLDEFCKAWFDMKEYYETKIKPEEDKTKNDENKINLTDQIKFK